MYYRPLQFFTIMQAAASIASILSKLHYLMPLEWVINICFVFGSAVLLGWLYWIYINQYALHCKFALLAIAIGCLVGVWL